jgi:hypothetical protein
LLTIGDDTSRTVRNKEEPFLWRKSLTEAPKIKQLPIPYVEEFVVNCFLLEALPQIKSSSYMRKYGK